jgi:hypothetical protein
MGQRLCGIHFAPHPLTLWTQCAQPLLDFDYRGSLEQGLHGIVSSESLKGPCLNVSLDTGRKQSYCFED